MRAVILAGGKGTRLSPYTSVFPKPLMPIDGFPILHVVIAQLRDAGFRHVTLAVGHMAHMIQTYFGDGKHFGVQIDYSMEAEPLGTIGALSLIHGLEDNFLVMNGDILTDLNFSDFIAFHQQAGGCATIASYSKKVMIEYGIIDFDGENLIHGYREKPSMEYQVSMGVYAFRPDVMRYVDSGTYLDFPNLIHRLIEEGQKVVQFPFKGYWMDIGCHADYEKAAQEFVKIKDRILKTPLQPPLSCDRPIQGGPLG